MKNIQQLICERLIVKNVLIGDPIVTNSRYDIIQLYPHSSNDENSDVSTARWSRNQPILILVWIANNLE